MGAHVCVIEFIKQFLVEEKRSNVRKRLSVYGNLSTVKDIRFETYKWLS